MLSNLEAIEIKNQSLNLTSSGLGIFRGDFETLNLESNFNIKFRSKHFFNLETIDIKNQSLT